MQNEIIENLTIKKNGLVRNEINHKCNDKL